MAAKDRVQSVFFTETETLEHMAFIPEQYELPIFLNKRIPIITHIDPKWCPFLEERMAYYRKIYHPKSKVVNERKFEKPAYFGCAKDPKDVPKDMLRERNWLLAPNRYKVVGHRVADIIHKSAGKKGPYACFTGERSEKTLMGYFKPKKFFGPFVNDFYNFPGLTDIISEPRNYFKYKIRKGNRKKQRPTLRFMLMDPSLCYRDPKDPGPFNYYPKNFCLETFISPKRVAKPYVAKQFYTMTTVPISDHILVPHQDLKPAPGRYSPEEIACPCRWHEPCPFAVRKGRKCLCEVGKFRNIIGGGWRWVFKSKLVRIIGKCAYVSKKGEKHIPIFDTAKYIRMISRPRRVHLFLHHLLKYDHQFMKPSKIRFNTTERQKKRTKLRVNKRICFMSGLARFPDIEISEYVVPKKRIVLPHYICKNKPLPDLPPGELPLSAFPYHLLPPRAKRKEVIHCFKPLPAPKVFHDQYITEQKDQHLYYKPLNVEDFFKRPKSKASSITDEESGEHESEVMIVTPSITRMTQASSSESEIGSVY